MACSPPPPEIQQTTSVKRFFFFFKLDHLCFSKQVLVRANVGGSGGLPPANLRRLTLKIPPVRRIHYSIWYLMVLRRCQNRNLGAEPQRDGISSEWKSSRRARPTFLLHSGASESQNAPNLLIWVMVKPIISAGVWRGESVNLIGLRVPGMELTTSCWSQNILMGPKS